MYYLNKIVFSLANPASFTLLLILAAVIFNFRVHTRKVATALMLLAFAYLAFFSIPFSMKFFGLPLESEYRQQNAEEAPSADAIVILGGGMCSNTNVLIYTEMSAGADRVWHAARLYRAGKAPLVIASGIDEKDSTLPLLLDFGVPADAIAVENDSRNTEENAKFTEDLLHEKLGRKAHIKVLLVTSAWHMRRAEMMFERYAPSLEIIPAPCDWEATNETVKPLESKHFIPSTGALDRNNAFFKEWLGFIGYTLFRH